MPPKESNAISSGRGESTAAGPSNLSRVGNFFADFGKAALSPLTEMAIVPAAEGITQGVVAKSGYSGKVTMSPEAKNKLNPFVDPVTGKVNRTEQAIAGASIAAGAGAGAAVGKVLPIVGRTISNKVTKLADIPDPITKFQGKNTGVGQIPDEKILDNMQLRGNVSGVSDYLNASKSSLAPTWKTLDEIPSSSYAPYDPYAKSAAQKAKATLAAGLTANPASAATTDIVQQVATVPRSSVTRLTRELGAGPKTNLGNRGAQFTMPTAARETSLAEFRAASAARAASKSSAITRATKSDANEAALQITGSAAGSAASNNTSSSVPDSAASSVTNSVAANTAAATVANKAKQLSTADTIASTRAEDLNQVINVVRNPFENSKNSDTTSTTTTKTKPTAKEKPTKIKPPLGGGMDVGGQNVKLQRVY